jgi:hypothetical protein
LSPKLPFKKKNIVTEIFGRTWRKLRKKHRQGNKGNWDSWLDGGGGGRWMDMEEREWREDCVRKERKKF